MMKTRKLQVMLAAGFVAALTLVGCASPNETAPPAEEPEVEEVAEESEPEPVQGESRDNPLPIGSTVTNGDWSVTINSVDLDATQTIMDYNEFNDLPADGNVYIMANATVTYNGSEPQGEMPTAIIEYVTADGNTIDLAWQDIPDEFTILSELYEGASHTGNAPFEVPASVDGVLSVMPDALFSEKSFVAIQ